MNPKKKHIILIVGSGRSGTSMLTEAFAKAGCYLGEGLIEANKFNERGYFENRRVVNFHKELLLNLGRAELAGSALALPANWSSELEPYHGRLTNILRQLARKSSSKFIAIKDPRASHLLPMWQSVTSALDWKLTVVLAFREPAATIDSIIESNRCSPLLAEALIMERCCSAINSKARLLLFDYDQCLVSPDKVLRKLFKSIGLKFNQDIASIIGALPRKQRQPLNLAFSGSARLYALLHWAARGWLPKHMLGICTEAIYKTWQRQVVLTRSVEHEKAQREQILELNHALRMSREKNEELRAELNGIRNEMNRDRAEAGRQRARANANFSLAQCLRWHEIDGLRTRLSPDAHAAVETHYGTMGKGEPQAAVHRILYLGPAKFVEGIWDTRAQYIFPDLLGDIPSNHEIHMLTGPVPDFARDALEHLCAKYKVIHHEPKFRRDGVEVGLYWLHSALGLAREINPSVITNIFGGVMFGYVGAHVAKLVGCRSVIRIAGDEISSRRAIGNYSADKERGDVAEQAVAFGLADAIVVMSPWEHDRISRHLSPAERNKTHVSIRGVDLSRFQPHVRKYSASGIRRFVYVGRNSLEKGYDIIEQAARLVSQEAPLVEFVFVGPFETKREGNCNYIGWVDSKNLPAIFEGADAFILTSRTEGFPQAVAEALATGLPCILPSHLFSGMFTDGEHVLLSSLDPADVAAAVIRLHRDAALGEQLSAFACRFARTSLDRELWRGRYFAALTGDNSGLSQNPFSIKAQ